MYVIPLTPFFVNVANDIGKDVIFDGISHPSILKIKNNTQHNTLFDFKPTDVDTVNKLVNKINIKNATGVDRISSKLLRAGAPVLNKHITTLVNNTIKTSVFPTRLKEAQVVPLHKKIDPLDKKNYRPVSILPTISKVYEMVLFDQLRDRPFNLKGGLCFFFRTTPELEYLFSLSRI